MYAGQLVELGSVRDVFLNPKHPYTQALIDAIPRLHSKDKTIRFIPGKPPALVNPPAGCRFCDRCPHSMAICKKDPPKLQIPNGGYVCCWLYDNDEQLNRKNK
jgi:oligopeptide/dipeptide ABC transporter ATP-binding protein